MPHVIWGTSKFLKLSVEVETFISVSDGDADKKIYMTLAVFNEYEYPSLLSPQTFTTLKTLKHTIDMTEMSLRST